MDNAAGRGRLDAVKWLHQNRKEGCTPAATINAASKGFFGGCQISSGEFSSRLKREGGSQAIKVENPAVSVGSDSVQDLPQVPEDIFIRRLISALRVNSELEVKDAAELRARIRTEVTASIQAELSSKIRAEEEAKVIAECVEAKLRDKIRVEIQADIEAKMRAKIRAELLRRCNICCRQAENSENTEGQQRYCHLFQTGGRELRS
ncbi:hypothetical protein GQ600_24212 [Phytophthora cactorum]|nr:hypothetical protein GQ600_24212 [Phytophthora cactorum]